MKKNTKQNQPSQKQLTVAIPLFALKQFKELLDRKHEAYRKEKSEVSKELERLDRAENQVLNQIIDGGGDSRKQELLDYLRVRQSHLQGHDAGHRNMHDFFQELYFVWHGIETPQVEAAYKKLPVEDDTLPF